MAELRRLLALGGVQRLELQRLPPHLDLQLLFDAMQHTPASLSISCRAQPAGGAGYEGPPQGMRAADVTRLAHVLAHPDCLLVSLDVSHNGLHDDAARMLASGLADNSSVTHVNLSSNRLSDRGARALARLLGSRSSVIRALDLGDNELRPDSGRALAHALRRSRALTSLSLRLNRLGDQGVAAVCDACGSAGDASATAAPLQHLNISSNAAGVGAAASVCSMLRSCQTLQTLDASGNGFGERMGLELLAAVAHSTCLAHMDVRGCGLGAQAERGVCQEVLARAERRDRVKLLLAAAAAT